MALVTSIRKHTYLLHHSQQRAETINDSQLGAARICLNSLLENNTGEGEKVVR
jgi:hypothetical protein